VINRGTRDAIGLHLRPVESTNYRLTSETIQHLEAQIREIEDVRHYCLPTSAEVCLGPAVGEVKALR
jgi:hypothetical protein